MRRTATAQAVSAPPTSVARRARRQTRMPSPKLDARYPKPIAVVARARAWLYHARKSRVRRTGSEADAAVVMHVPSRILMVALGLVAMWCVLSNWLEHDLGDSLNHRAVWRSGKFPHKFLDKIDANLNATATPLCSSDVLVLGNRGTLAQHVKARWFPDPRPSGPWQSRFFNAVSYFVIIQTSLTATHDLVATKLQVSFLGGKPVSYESDFAYRGLAQRLQGRRYFFAALLHNNEAVLPFWQRELLKTLLVVANRERSNVFVSIYESGSTDATQAWLRELELALQQMGVPSNIHIGGSDRGSYPGRIEHLAALRNEALKPMLDGTESWDEVVYLNDVFFCAEGVIEMLLSGRESNADMVCSTDYVGVNPKCDDEDCPDLRLYDIWVAHGVSGKKFRNEPPYMREKKMRDRHMSGRPYPVVSCWNGMVVMNANLFQQARLRFRAGTSLECSASECELFCRDMWAIGRNKIMITPNVQTAYELPIFERAYSRLHDQRSKQQVVWSDRLAQSERSLASMFNPHAVRSSVLTEPVEWELKKGMAAQDQLECCPLKAGSNIVEFDKCFLENVTRWNSAFEVPRAVSPISARASSAADSLRTISELSAALYKTHCRNETRLAVSTSSVPARITQIGRTEVLDELPLAVRQAVLSWLMTNPCHEYIFLTDEKIDQFVRTNFVQYLDDFKTLKNGGEKADLARYLYMYANGGVYADTDTVSMAPVSDWVKPGDNFVVGLEADFINATTAVEWVYARQKSLSLHCFAVAPRHKALWRVVESVIYNVRSAKHVYTQVRDRGVGLPSHLSTIFKTGPGAFTDSVLASQEAGVTILGINALSGGHSQGNIFYDKQTTKSVRDTTIYVKHLNLGSWLRPSIFMPMKMATNFDYLESGAAMLGGQWISSYDGPSLKSQPVWRIYAVPDMAAVNKPLFLFFTNGGELQVVAGFGPDDQDSVTLWSRSARAPNDATGSTPEFALFENGALGVRFTNVGAIVEESSLMAWVENNDTRRLGTAEELLMQKLLHPNGAQSNMEAGCFFLVLHANGVLAIYRGTSPLHVNTDLNSDCCSRETRSQPRCTRDLSLNPLRSTTKNDYVSVLQPLRASPSSKYFAVTMPQGQFCIFDSHVSWRVDTATSLPDLKLAKWCSFYKPLNTPMKGDIGFSTELQLDGSLVTYDKYTGKKQHGPTVWTHRTGLEVTFKLPYQIEMSDDAAAIRLLDQKKKQVWTSPPPHGAVKRKVRRGSA